MEITDLHNPFMKWLRQMGVPFIRSRSDRESTTHPGDPDFTLLLNNRALFLEMKWEGGTLSKAQKERHAELQRAGNVVHVVRSMERAIEITSAWLATIGEPQDRTLPADGLKGLHRHGEGVFRKVGAGHWDFVRKATPADAGLPPLS